MTSGPFMGSLKSSRIHETALDERFGIIILSPWWQNHRDTLKAMNPALQLTGTVRRAILRYRSNFSRIPCPCATACPKISNSP